MGIELSWESTQVLFAFGCYLAGVAAFGFFSHRYLARGSFVKEYFLGNRGLGAWVLALTLAATAISGGTFMGFPSLIYTNGWVMALWICSYMLNPVMSMALFGKRINQMARVSGAVTVPDMFRDRFASPALGIISTLLILFFLVFNLVAQFKAGGLVMQAAMNLPPARAEFQKAQADPAGNEVVVSFTLPGGKEEKVQVRRPDARAVLLEDQTAVDPVSRQVTLKFDLDGQVSEKKVLFPAQKLFGQDKGYLFGLIIFAITVIAYTTYGGFWAVTWTDVLEGFVMFAGVLVMAVLAVQAVPAITVERQQGDAIVKEELHGLSAATEKLRQINPSLVYGPGPRNFLPLGLAFSYFCMWTLMSAGQPAGMVRLMSFKDTSSFRRALLVVVVFYIVTYLALLVIFVCARAIYPTQYLGEMGSEGQPDSITPVMARELARNLTLFGFTIGPFVAGLLMAAPYAAIMSTVAAFLLMISSSLVRDLYQRTINPKASDKTLKRVSYTVTALVGVIVLLGALNPPRFLQYIIVFTGSGQACSFLFPMWLGLYWKRTTRQGMLAGILGGFAVLLGLYVLGWVDSASDRAVREYTQAVDQAKVDGTPEPAEPGAALWLQRNMTVLPGWGEARLEAFAPLYLFGIDPVVWGLLASLGLGVGVSLWTKPDEKLAEKYFPA